VSARLGTIGPAWNMIMKTGVRVRAIVAVLVLVAGLLPPPAAAADAEVDPGRAGSYPVFAGEYTLPAVRLPGLAVPVEMRALVIAPAHAPGSRPLILFLHGRHDTCRDPRSETGGWPCPHGSTAIRSYQGFRYAQRLLASQGYDTVSIAANGISAQDGDLADGGAAARSALVRLHLADWAAWSAGAGRTTAPAVIRAVPPADLSKVLLVGHSRGGEGVSQAATDSSSPLAGFSPVRWTIRGIVLVAPTALNRNPNPDVPSMTLLPGCDGDVSDLSGQAYVDATRGVGDGRALHSAVWVAGANHNYFSTAWPADDYAWRGDRICSPGEPTRLTGSRQRAVARTYIAAAAALFVAGDDRVRPLLDGTGAAAPSAGRALVLAEALGGGRTPLFVPARSDVVTGARLCLEVTTCLDGRDTARCPHFVPLEPAAGDPGRLAVALRWTAAGRAVSLRPATPASVTGDTAVAMRIVLPPDAPATRFAVSVTDRDGRRAALGDVSLTGLPATAVTTAYWGQEVRVPLTAAAGLDRAHLIELRLVPGTRTGAAWLLDAWGWRAGTSPPSVESLPRVDVAAAVVRRGSVVIPVTGRGAGLVRVFLTGRTTTSQLVALHPAGGPISVRLGSGHPATVLAEAVRGAVVGSARRVLDGD
jgi:hypothetical protein